MDLCDFIETGRIRCTMRSYKERKRRAIECAASALSNHSRAYASISGGKDSVALAMIVDEAARLTGCSFDLWAHVSDASFPGTEEILRAVSARIKRNLYISKSERSAFEILASTDQKRAFGKTGVFFDSIRSFVNDKEMDLCFTGVRAYESKRRMKAAQVHGDTFQSNVAGEITVCNPLTWFRLEDVAAALVEYDAPIHPIYSKMSVDVSKNRNGEQSFIRLGYITSRDLLNKGTIVFLRTNYPDLYAKLCKAWTDARNYI